MRTVDDVRACGRALVRFSDAMRGVQLLPGSQVHRSWWVADHAVADLRRAGLADDALAWADVLHEGPVPAGLDEFFQEVGQPVAAGQFLPPPVLDPQAIQRLQALAQSYGQQVFPPNYLG